MPSGQNIPVGMKGIVTKSTGSRYTVMAVDGTRYECKLKGTFKIKDISSTNPISVGDNVDFEFPAIKVLE